GTHSSSNSGYDKNILSILIEEIIYYIKKHSQKKRANKIQNGMSLLGDKIECGVEGDCLFRSVASFMPEGISSYEVLRKLTAEVISNNQELFSEIINSNNPEVLTLRTGRTRRVTDVQDYVEYIAQAGTWGGYIELYLLASILNRPIALLSDRYRPQIFKPHISQEESGEPIFLYYNGGTHYQALLVPEGESAQNIFQKLESLSDINNSYKASSKRKSENFLEKTPAKRKKGEKAEISDSDDDCFDAEGAQEEEEEEEEGKREESKSNIQISTNDEHTAHSDLLTRFSQPASRNNRRIDSLARLLEGDSMCVAVALVNNEILVTTNELKEYKKIEEAFVDNARAMFMEDILSHFLKIAGLGTIDEVDHINLLAKICSKKIKSTQRDSAPENQIKLDKDLLRIIIDDLYKSPDIEAKHWAMLEATANDFFERGLLSEAERDLWLLRDNSETRYRSGKELTAIGQKIYQIKAAYRFLWHTIRDFKKCTEFFTKEWSTVRACKILAVGEDDEHAEARMIGFLLETGKLIPTDSSTYIGISKLCCACCASIVYVVNEALHTSVGLQHSTPPTGDETLVSQADLKKSAEDKAREEGDEYVAVNVRGQHGIFRSNWISNSSYLKGFKYLSPSGTIIRCINRLEGANEVRSTNRNLLVVKNENKVKESQNKIKNKPAAGYTDILLYQTPTEYYRRISKHFKKMQTDLTEITKKRTREITEKRRQKRENNKITRQAQSESSTDAQLEVIQVKTIHPPLKEVMSSEEDMGISMRATPSPPTTPEKKTSILNKEVVEGKKAGMMDAAKSFAELFGKDYNPSRDDARSEQSDNDDNSDQNDEIPSQ
ncbi:MAG: hypothetical protein K0R24_1594, partial [Gammaproteobacteria bacterium]|nr:hypothetical protein [Gammaproteobacteria bacterium]